MREISKSQIAAIHAILNKKGLIDDKVKIVQEMSDGRTSSITQLYWQEAQDWIAAMNKSESEKVPADAPMQKMINNIIAMAREMGVVFRANKVTAGGGIKLVSDYSRLDAWMKEKSYLKKPLREYTYNELPKLVSQYKNVYFSWLKARSK